MLTYRTIVVGTDLSDGAEAAAHAALAIASRLGAQRVHLVHVVHTSPMLPAPLVPEAVEDVVTRTAQERAQQRLDDLELPRSSVWVQREVRVGSPARELAEAAVAHRADLIVVARRGHTPLARLVLGSVPNGLIRIAHCPVLVMGEPADDPRFDGVLAAVDLSPVSGLVLENAVAVSCNYAAQVDVLSLFEQPPESPEDEHLERARLAHQDAVAALVERTPRQGVGFDIHVMKKAPVSQTIIEVARSGEAELIVMGTSGRNAWHRMILGSTAHHVLLRAACAVLVVPPLARDTDLAPDDGLARAALGSNQPC